MSDDANLDAVDTGIAPSKGVSALDQLLLDLFNTALEGGIGYWSSCQEYHWTHSVAGARTPGADNQEDHKGFYALITEEEGDEQTPHTIDRSVMLRGYGRAASQAWRNRIAWSSGEKPPLVVGPDTDWDFDASDADAIVQLGLFGEVVYG